jgi:WD40 repeat protein
MINIKNVIKPGLLAFVLFGSANLSSMEQKILEFYLKPITPNESDIAIAKNICRRPLRCDHEVISLAFYPDANILASFHGNGTVMLWKWSMEEKEWGCVSKITDPEEKPIYQSPNGAVINLGFVDSAQVDWSNIPTRVFEICGITSQWEYTIKFRSAIFSPDGSLLVFASFEPMKAPNCSHVELWDVDKKSRIGTFECGLFNISTIKLSQDGTQIAVGLHNTDDGENWIQTWTNLLAQKILSERKPGMLALLQGTQLRLGENSPVYLLSDFPRLPGFPLHMICEMISVPTTAELWRKALGK